MFRAQNAFEGVISNYPSRLAAWLLRRVIFPFGRPYVVPSDQLGHAAARLLIEPGATRDRLSAGMYLPLDEDDAVGGIELALAATMAAEPIEAKIRAAQKQGKLDDRFADHGTAQLAEHACAAGIITAAELAVLERRAVLRDKVIRVDDFPQDFGLSEVAAAPSASLQKAA